MKKKITFLVIMVFAFGALLTVFGGCSALEDAAEDSGLVSTYDADSTQGKEITAAIADTDTLIYTDDATAPDYAAAVPSSQETAFEGLSLLFSTLGETLSKSDTVDAANVVGKCDVTVSSWSYVLYMYADNSGYASVKETVCTTIGGTWTANTNE